MLYLLVYGVGNLLTCAQGLHRFIGPVALYTPALIKPTWELREFSVEGLVALFQVEYTTVNSLVSQSVSARQPVHRCFLVFSVVSAASGETPAV